MDARIAAARRELGRECVILGHHYQRDEVVRFADYTGDSYRLSQVAAQTEGRYIVFCGVHFMAESADVLARPSQSVILPDLNAGCSMADMAEIGQVEDAWEQFIALGLTDDEGNGITPITYMNSTAAIKAFCGERGGLVCTSSNATRRIFMGICAQPEDFLPARPAPGPQHRIRARHTARRDGGVGSVPASGWLDGRAPAQSQGDPVEGPLLGASALPAGARRQGSRQVSRHPGRGPSRVPLGGLPESRRDRLDRSNHQDREAVSRREAHLPSAPKST